MNRFGFELELFCFDREIGALTIPPSGVPTDGFPGLVELRTKVHTDVVSAWTELIEQHAKLSNAYPQYQFFTSPTETFSREQKAELRRRSHIKQQWDIQNLYGKAPRLLGNKTIASLQFNTSYVDVEGYNQRCCNAKCKSTYYIPTQYNPLDIPKIIRALDLEFEEDIKEAKRQPGEYCLKTRRLEYRSLPPLFDYKNYNYETAFRIKRVIKALHA